jgi:hypothetical protein
MKRYQLILLSTVLLCSSFVEASWLSKVTGVDIKVRSSGSSIKIDKPQPEAIKDAIEHFPDDLKNFLNPAGTLLAIAIRDARDSVRPGAKKIPPNVRAALKSYFPKSILDRVRWDMRSQAGFGLDSLVLKVGDADAITLDDTIVFRMGGRESTDIVNLELWAHELSHVIQYQNMGVEGFANVYSVNWSGLENQAERWATGVRNDIENGNASTRYSTSNYQNLNNIGSAKLSQQQFQKVAMNYVPPMNCVYWRTPTPVLLEVRNLCNVPIRMLGATKVNPMTGQHLRIPCQANCFVSARGGWTYNLTPPGPVSQIGFDFVR